MLEKDAQKLKKLVKFPAQTETIKVPKEYKTKVKEVLPENIEPENDLVKGED
jgi:hypothetical protein